VNKDGNVLLKCNFFGDQIHFAIYLLVHFPPLLVISSAVDPELLISESAFQKVMDLVLSNIF
jgi:hypothetical protein